MQRCWERGRRRVVAVLLLGLFALGQPAVVWGDDVPSALVGLWQMQDGGTIVQIAGCGEGTLCGRIVRLDPSLPATDVHNPEEPLRSRPLCRLAILTALRPSGPNHAVGWFYHPQQGTEYQIRLFLEAPDRLRLAGTTGRPILTRSFAYVEEWRRVDGVNPACSPAPSS